MSEQLIEKYETMLNEEKWTRATINNYTIKNFEELDILMEEFVDNHILQEVFAVTAGYLNHNKNSIGALYVSSMLQIRDGSIENNDIYNLIKIFSDNLKWNIVEFLASKVLEKIDDKVIVRAKIDAYNNLGKKDDLVELWEKLIRVDYEEAPIVVKLANIKEEEGEVDEAINYYKKAINRFILNKNFPSVEELWKKLLTYESVNYDFFITLDKKITKNFSAERSIDLLDLLYQQYRDNGSYDIALKILKIILEKDPEDEFGRKELVEMYKKKYASHSQLDTYIKKSNLDATWRNVNESILSFEKHIAFDKGNFVHHNTWGLGVIQEINNDEFVINFQKSQKHKMSLKLALTSLQVLPKNHIWILKLKNLDKLKEKVKSDILWAVKIIIMSYGNKALMKDFRRELVPDVLTQSQWTSWWNSAKKVLSLRGNW